MKTRKLTRKSLDELAVIMPIIDKNGQNGFVGGTIVTSIRINGGYLISYDYENEDLVKLTVYQPDSGSTIVFDGVTCSTGSLNGSAYQFNGIKVGEDSEANFDIGTMIHEYGHFLQQEEMGTVAYLAYAGSGSAYGYTFSGVDYYDIPSEKNASERGQEYMDQYYSGSSYTADGL
jgi:hypothetical protein